MILRLMSLWCILAYGCLAQKEDTCQTEALALGGNEFSSAEENSHAFVISMQKNPSWKKILPSVCKDGQMEMEKYLGQEKHIKNISLYVHFFTQHPPYTYEGWKFCLAHMDKKISVKKLVAFWPQASLSMQKQRAFLQDKNMRRCLSVKTHCLRIEHLLWKNDLEAAKALLTFLQLSTTHPLYMAYRLLVKEAVKKDPQVVSDFHTMSSSQKQTPLLIYAYRKYLLRAEKPRDVVEHIKASGWNIRTFCDNVKGHILEKESKEAYQKMMILLLRDLIQEGEKYQVENNLSEAEKSFSLLINMHENGIIQDAPYYADHWAEAVWLEGFAYYQGKKEYKKACRTFLSLVKAHTACVCPSAYEILYTQDMLPQTQKIPSLPKVSEDRYLSRCYYWAGKCYDQQTKNVSLKEKQQCQKAARCCYTLASPYVFFFYGQLANEKLGNRPKVVFAQAEGTKKFCGYAQKECEKIAQIWMMHSTKERMAACHKRLWFFLKDMSAHMKTPSDKKRFLMLCQQLSPLSVVYWARRFATSLEATFREMYPVISLPIKAKDPALIHAIILTETCFNPFVSSAAGAKGLMQIMPNEEAIWAKKAGVPVGGIKKLLSPSYNMILGITEIKDRLSLFDKYFLAIAAYNAGPTRVRRWLSSIPQKDPLVFIESIPYNETRAYVHRVLESRFVYAQLLGGSVSDRLFLCKGVLAEK